MFAHLRVRSSYSFLDGLASPSELVQAAVACDMPALALSDEHMLTGAIEFYDACLAAGIQPVLGLSLRIVNENRLQSNLALFAMNTEGWRSLCRLSSAANQGGESLNFEQVAQESAGLICLDGGRNGLAASWLARGQVQAARDWLSQLTEVFADRLYVELQMHTNEDKVQAERLAMLAQNMHLPAAATHCIHYLRPEQAALQRVVSAIRLICPLASLPAEAAAPPDAYFIRSIEMQQRFAAYPQALEATMEVVERCRLDLPLGRPLFPDVPAPAGQTALDVLRQKAEAGALRLYGEAGELPGEVRARLERELAVIDECGYAALFLIVEEILVYARQHEVPISSRGSAASSLVAHCLGITSPDPLRLNLYFERFLNPARATPPDIDTDLCSRRREDVIRFVYERFGQERVATVCTINRFRSRSALREVAKAYGLPSDDVSALADALPQRWYGPPQRGNRKDAPYVELAERFPTPAHQVIFRDAAALIGLPHHLSVHPGGMVIAPGALTDLVPIQMAAKGVMVTQFDLEAIERLGLVKIDLLGIRGLTVLGDVAEALSASLKGTDANPPVFAHSSHPSALDILDGIPGDDPATQETILHGRTIGCFQIESPGMRSTLKEIRAHSVDDLMVALALYRPGPLIGGLKDAFVRRHLGKEAAAQLHPALTPLLADTYGVILYQEQVLRIAHELAGLSLADADLLRRAMSHFDPGKQMQTLKEKFVAGAWQRSAVPEAIAVRVWELMAAFAGYGFPKAHAASYAQIGWRSAWCKTHYPALFLAAVLANWGGYYSQRVYLNEVRRLGLALSPPNVNYARREFSVRFLEAESVLFMGLDQVRDLTRRTQEAILHGQPFRSLQDFLVRVDPRQVEVENLARCGALENFGTIPAVLGQVSLGGWRGGQLSLFNGLGEYGLNALPSEDDWTLEQKVAAQEEILGTGVVAHPLELVAAQIGAAGALTTLDAAARLGQRVRVAGMRQVWRRSMDVRGDYIYFMSLEDLDGMLEVVIRSNVYRHSRAALSTVGPYLIEGRVELDSEVGEPFILAERIDTLR